MPHEIDPALDAGAAPTHDVHTAIILWLALAGVTLAGLWKVFDKADKPGWAAFIPGYNMYVLSTIVGRPAWMVFLMGLPLIGIVPALIVSLDLSRSFGKGVAFALGLLVCPVVFLPVLGFGEAEYEGPRPLGEPEPPPPARFREPRPPITPRISIEPRPQPPKSFRRAG